MLINWFNIWLFYVIGYIISAIFREITNKIRGEPFEDPEALFKFKGKKIFIIAMLWLFGGFVISLFIPVIFGPQFYVGLAISIVGLIIVLIAFFSLAGSKGLAMNGAYKYSRNPNYVGWIIFFGGLSVMSWAITVWGLMFFVYFIVSIIYLHWTTLLEEEFLTGKYGDTYKEYLAKTPRYLGKSKL